MALLLAGAIVYFQYFFKKKVTRDSKVLAFLRFISLLGVLALLINPKFEQKTTEVIKPKLLLGTDNSASILHADSAEELRKLRQQFLTDEALNQRFEMSDFLFGSGLDTDSLLSFTEQQTNIFNAVQDLDALTDKQKSAIILLTDGHQTFGRNYAYMATKSPVFPMAIGDTTERLDISISRVNVNAYATLENNFPVEIFLNSNVTKNLNSKLIVERNGIELYASPVTFSTEERSKQITFYLPADSIGMQLYRAKLLPFSDETELRNNNKNFGVEVLDEKTEVAIVYGVLHPDLGAIKRSIESNKQRKATLIHINEFQINKDQYTFYVLYQPNMAFSSLFKDIEKEKLNYLLITGTHTDWNFLNQIQKSFSKVVTGELEEYLPAYQEDFDTFYAEDIGFESFPPLQGQFGEVNFNNDHKVMINQKINDVLTDTPLLAILEGNANKSVVLFGENIWKWRSHNFELYDSFERFDIFFNNLIQFLQLSDRDKKMELFYKPVYHAQEGISIQVKNYDSNLNIELNSKLVLQLNDSLDEIPFYIRNNSYEVQMNSLETGTYSFEVKELGSNKVMKGTFVVEAFSLEDGATRPNIEDLELLAQNSGGSLFYHDQFQAIKTNLLDNSDFRSTQIERNKMISLIDWRWLLGLIVLSLSLEWFLRKYRGMI